LSSLAADTVALIYFISVFGQIAFLFCFVCLAAKQFVKHRNKSHFVPQHPVSIIICAKNEAQNLQKNLPAILSQDYKNAEGESLYEIIVVNDHSTDDTKKVLEYYHAQYPKLQVIDNDAATSGKKAALYKGVSIAKHNWLLFTDADCTPASLQWIKLMIAPLAQGKEIVAGYGQFYSEKTIINKFIRAETVHSFVQAYCYHAAGMPYMALGRNMACTREIYMKAIEDEQYRALPYGDDDLLINTCANAHNMTMLINPASFTVSPAKAGWHEWKAQKQRHLSTGKYYRFAPRLLLGLYAFTHTLYWLSFIVLLLFHNSYWLAALCFMLSRFFFFQAILNKAAGLLKEKNLSVSFLFFDFAWMLYNFAFAPYILWKNKKQWK